MIQKLLIIRFSALGDVAMTIPIVASLARHYPDLQITMLSQSKFAPLFTRMPANVTFYGVRLKPDYSGIQGLNRLYNELKINKFDAVADLHDVLRTQILTLKFRCAGVKVCTIQKGRWDKHMLVHKPQNKKQLPTSFDRYQSVFKKLHFEFSADFEALYDKTANSPIFNRLTTFIPDFNKSIEKRRVIGIAPFAKHAGKIYPVDKMYKVVQQLIENVKSSTYIFLFGGPGKEAEILSQWAADNTNIINLAGRFTFDEEIQIMSKMQVMVTMDSANMHLASLVEVPVVSVWGATHPYAGFLGWRQKYENAVQIDLPCRPCSIFGNKPCKKGNYECLNLITPDMIVQKIEEVLA